MDKFTFALRIELNAEKQKISVDQTKYILSLLDRFGMADCNKVSTPLDLNQDLFVCGEADENLRVPYQELIGCLTNVAQSTRPDIAYAIGLLSRFNQSYSQIHLIAAKRVLQYLQRDCRIKIDFQK